MSGRLARMDSLVLASEVARHAAVAARHGSRAAVAEDARQARLAADWRRSAAFAEEEFLVEVDEVRRRLAAGGSAAEDLRRYLELYDAASLVGPAQGD